MHNANKSTLKQMKDARKARKALEAQAAHLTANSTTGTTYCVTTDRNGKDIIVSIPGR